MFKINIQSEKHGPGFLEFANLAEAQAYIAEVTASEHWGSLEKTIEVPAVLDEEQNVIEPATTIVIPATWSYEIIDVTEEKLAEARKAKNVKRINFAIGFMAEIASTNALKLQNNELTLEQVVSAEEKLAKVQRLMYNSSLPLALQEIIAIEATLTEYPQAYKEELKQKIIAYLASE